MVKFTRMKDERKIERPPQYRSVNYTFFREFLLLHSRGSNWWCIQLLKELAYKQRILYYEVSRVLNRKCCNKCRSADGTKTFPGTFCFLAKARCLSFSASRLSRFLRHFSSSGGNSLSTMSVSSTTRRTARSGNKPAVDRYRTSASVRGKPSRIKPVDLKKRTRCVS